MKIIALLPFRNEEWILPTYISSMKLIADEIIAVYDDCEDKSIEILKANNVIVMRNKNWEANATAEDSRKQLLEIGRKRGGTHFICLDADEVFSSSFIPKARGIINCLVPGQKLLMPWLYLWNGTESYRKETIGFTAGLKDFAFCDDQEMDYDDKIIHGSRTPSNNIICIKDKVIDNINDASVLHFHFVNYEFAVYKSIYYMCFELIQTPKRLHYINKGYACVFNENPQCERTDPNWFKGLVLPDLFQLNNKILVYISEIYQLFDQKGIEYFELLQIWSIPELQKEFIKRTGRHPRTWKEPIYYRLRTSLKNILKIRR